jgi:hypothetical protein
MAEIIVENNAAYLGHPLVHGPTPEQKLLDPLGRVGLGPVPLIRGELRGEERWEERGEERGEEQRLSIARTAWSDDRVMSFNMLR